MAMSVEKLVEHFSALEDPRCAGKVDHRLIDILVIAVCAVIACAESWDDIALYGRNKVGWLRSFSNRVFSGEGIKVGKQGQRMKSSSQKSQGRRMKSAHQKRHHVLVIPGGFLAPGPHADPG
jgi:hypothetical protein